MMNYFWIKWLLDGSLPRLCTTQVPLTVFRTETYPGTVELITSTSETGGSALLLPLEPLLLATSSMPPTLQYCSRNTFGLPSAEMRTLKAKKTYQLAGHIVGFQTPWLSPPRPECPPHWCPRLCLCLSRETWGKQSRGRPTSLWNTPQLSQPIFRGKFGSRKSSKNFLFFL